MSTTTIVHLGDTHLQSTNPRNAARLRALDQIIAEGMALPDLGAWLWPGDLFHGRSTATDRNDLAERLTLMANQAPVVIVRGNHDAPGDLDIFAMLNTAEPIYVIDEPMVLRVSLAMGRIAAVACLPYPTKGGLIAAGETAETSGPVAGQLLLSVCRGLAAELADARADGLITLAAGHVNVAGSVASNGQPQIGVELSADAECFVPFAGDYIGLNHIHKPQDIAGASFAGSIAAMDYGEVHDHAYTVVSYTLDEATDRWSYEVTRRPIETARLYHVESSWSPAGRFDWSVTAGPGGVPQEPPASWEGCEVRVRVRYDASNRAILNFDELRAPFAGADRIDLEPIAVPDTQVRAPQVAAARTLADKLSAWAELNGATLAPSVIEKLAALERGDAATLILQAAQAPREERAA